MHLKSLPGLGEKSAAELAKIGIETRDDLEKLGAFKTYIKLMQASETKPSLNFLYAMVGALENRDWRDVAKKDKADLILQLDAYMDIESLN